MKSLLAIAARLLTFSQADTRTVCDVPALLATLVLLAGLVLIAARCSWKYLFVVHRGYDNRQ